MSSTLFRKSSLENISSPEQLNDYIKVSNPGIWMVLAALFILLAAVLVWGFAGSLPTTIKTKGIVSGGNAVCYVETKDAAAIEAGQTVKISAGTMAADGRVTGIGAIPLSTSEISSELKSDYMLQQLLKGGFAVKVTISLGSTGIPEGTLIDIGIVTSAVKPIDFLLK